MENEPDTCMHLVVGMKNGWSIGDYGDKKKNSKECMVRKRSQDGRDSKVISCTSLRFPSVRICMSVFLLNERCDEQGYQW